jgi:hypothetical protein
MRLNGFVNLGNKYVHLNLDKPFLEMNAWFNNQDQLEAEATKAIQNCYQSIFSEPRHVILKYLCNNRNLHPCFTEEK